MAGGVAHPLLLGLNALQSLNSECGLTTASHSQPHKFMYSSDDPLQICPAIPGNSDLGVNGEVGKLLVRSMKLYKIYQVYGSYDKTACMSLYIQIIIYDKPSFIPVEG